MRSARAEAASPRSTSTCRRRTAPTADWTPQRLIQWGQRIGLATGEVVTRILEQNEHSEHGYRAGLGLLGLAKRYGNERLEAACERALVLGAFKYRHVRDILLNNRAAIEKLTRGVRIERSWHEAGACGW